MNTKHLKARILDLALQGKLVENSRIPNDLNSRIPSDFNPPFKIPNSWQWVKLGDICEINLGKTPPSKDKSFWGGDYPWVSISDLIHRKVITKTEKSVNQKSYDEIFSKKIVKKGTLLLSFKLTIGKTSILGFDGFHNEAIASIIPKDAEQISQNFLFNFLEVFVKFAKYTPAIKGDTLNKEILKSLPIPLPPLDEQERIVKKIDELFEILEVIENSL